MRFFACNKSVTLKSHKTWWPGYCVVWGHVNGASQCEFIYVTEQDYDAYVAYVNQNPTPYTETYEMNALKTEGLIGHYYRVSDFTPHKGRFCVAS